MESMFRNAESILNESDAADTLAWCLDVPRWVDAVLDARPFTDVDSLRTAIFSAAAPFTSDEIDRALRVHPRIGECADGVDAVHARTEQAGVDTSDAEIAQRLTAGNLAYEQRFGRVFLIRAAGRDAADILAALERRLTNDHRTELAVVEHELREIAAVRATGGVGDD